MLYEINSNRTKIKILSNIIHSLVKNPSMTTQPNLPIPPAPKKKASSKKSKKKYANLPIDEKTEIAARNLLRIYQFLQMDKPLTEETLIKEIELDTPNEELRETIMQLKLEIESLHEENHALQQTALRTQVEAEEQVEAVGFQNEELKQKIKEMDSIIQNELERRANEYEQIIAEIRKKLKESIAQNEKYTEVNEGIKQLQKQVSNLFEQNDELLNKNTELKKTIDKMKQEYEEREEFVRSLEKKTAELQKKTELQAMVIKGYKRKERNGDSSKEE